MFQINRKGHPDDKSIRQNVYLLPDGGQKLEYLTFPSLERTGIVRHLFSTRLGGVSEGDLGTMNLSFTRGDRRENVLENYDRIGAVLGCKTEDMIASHQTHTTNIRHVTRADRGKGILFPRDYENVDGLITGDDGIVLVTYYADCVPLFFVDTVHRAVGLAHSGWRGTAEGMGACMVEAMGKAFGTRPEQLTAAIGPSICGDCYEVSEDVAERFFRFPGAVRKGRVPGKYQLDLWLANRQILNDAGIPDAQITVTDICTCCNSGYLFSHRASGGRRGNLAAFLGLTSERN
jgi:hypothetical protein